MTARQAQILSVDFAFYDDRTTNTNYSSTRTLLEHEIAIWRPEYLLNEYGTTGNYEGDICLDNNGSAQYKRDLKRRTRDIREFLELGRTLVVLLPPPLQFYIATGERRNDGTRAKPNVKRIVEARQLSETLPHPSILQAASGEAFEIVGDAAFAKFWRGVGDQFVYESFCEVENAEPLLRVPGTKRVVAARAEVASGTVLYLPHLLVDEPEVAEQGEDESDDEYLERWELANADLQEENDGALIDALLEYVGGSSATLEPLPSWVDRIVLPREQRVKEKAEQAARKAEAARAEAEEARAEVARVRAKKALVALDGNGLEEAVAAAFEELGAAITAGAPGRADRILNWKGKKAVIEVKGSVKSASERNAAQLEKWVAEHTAAGDDEEDADPPKGILVVNAWREVPLPERDSPAFPDQMLAYSEARGHCLLESAQLLTALVTATNQTKRAAFLDAVFATNGVLEGWQWSEELEVVSADSEA
jgi:hypothetical protein